MKISKKRWDAMKRRGRSGARRAAGGAKANGMQMLAGALVNLIESKVVENFPAVASQGWWAPPAAMVGIGLLAKRSARFRGVGDALLGAAGYSAAFRYRSMAASAEAGRVLGLPFRPHLIAGGAPAALPAEGVPAEAGRVYRRARAY